jgi:hypothetical protein
MASSFICRLNCLARARSFCCSAEAFDACDLIGLSRVEVSELLDLAGPDARKLTLLPALNRDPGRTKLAPSARSLR